jgi:hypothetical protein
LENFVSKEDVNPWVPIHLGDFTVLNPGKGLDDKYRFYIIAFFVVVNKNNV